MAVKKILAQKIKHPSKSSWIETMYIQEDVSNQNANPSIYLHGVLADSNAMSNVVKLTSLSTGIYNGTYKMKLY